MNKIIHTQGLWELLPDHDEFKIISTEANQEICVVRKQEDAALIVCAHVMFAALGMASDALRRDDTKENRERFANDLQKLLRQANGQGMEIRYGAIYGKSNRDV
jgi:hypothetical protein